MKKEVRLIYEKFRTGDVLMDVSETVTWSELWKMTRDDRGWQERVRAIKDKVHKNSSVERNRRKKKKRDGDRGSDEDEDDEWERKKKRPHKHTNNMIKMFRRLLH